LSTFHRFGTAIAAIVCTAFVVILVVAIAVSLVIRQRAGRLAALILWVETLALIAVILLHLSTFHRFGAAIAAIVCTAFVVVLVVAIAVSLVIRQRAGRLASLILWVETLALFAVILLHSTAHTFRATVAAVEITTLIVVVVVAVAIALVLLLTTCRPFFGTFGTRVKALALFAVSLFDGTPHTFRATVTAVILTAFVVVIIVTVAIALVLFLTTSRRFLFGFGIRIKALALLTVILLHSTAHTLRATVTAVVLTAFVVVVVVAVAIPFVLLLTTCRPFFWTFGTRVKALALFAVSLFDGTSHTLRTAIAAVKIASAVVIIVVTVTVAFVLCRSAFPGTILRRFVFGVQTLTLFAVIRLDLSAIDRLRTAIATIIAAACVVVIVVAVAIASVLKCATVLELFVQFAYTPLTIARVFILKLLARVGFFDSPVITCLLLACF